MERVCMVLWPIGLVLYVFADSFGNAATPLRTLVQPYAASEEPSGPGWEGRVLVGRSSQNVVTNSSVENGSSDLKLKKGSDLGAGDQSASHAALKSFWENRHEVRCGEGNVTLQIRGRLSHLLLDQAGVGPVPVTKLQRDCGFSFKRTKRGTEMVAPFHGCHEMQQDGSFTLPLYYMGQPQPITCPRHATTAAPDPTEWFPPFPFYPFPFPPFGFPAPSEAPTTTRTHHPHFPPFPFFPFPPFGYPLPPPPTPAPHHPSPAPPPFPYPFFPFFPPFYNPFPTHAPKTHAPKTNAPCRHPPNPFPFFPYNWMPFVTESPPTTKAPAPRWYELFPGYYVGQAVKDFSK